jgi:isochorismate synthase
MPDRWLRLFEQVARTVRPNELVSVTVGCDRGPDGLLAGEGECGGFLPGDGGLRLVWRGATVSVTASGDRRCVHVRQSAQELLSRMADLREPGLDALPGPVLVGGLAFRPDVQRGETWQAFGDGSFTLPRWVWGQVGGRAFVRLTLVAGELHDPNEARAVALEASRIGQHAELEANPYASASQDADDETTRWRETVQAALRAMTAGQLDKVVLAREATVRLDRPLDPDSVVRRLAAVERDATVFAFQRQGKTFLGATPELLVRRTGRQVTSEALAGTAADAAPQSTLQGDKIEREHGWVREAVREALGPLCDALHIDQQPTVRELQGLRHLRSRVEGTLTTDVHVLDLVERLHPTPATCGTPRPAALAFLKEHEGFDRGWYAGAVGWFDAKGDGCFVVALRCGLVEADRVRLYAGAGLVRGSDAQAEWTETRWKLQPMLRALGGTA